MSHTNYISHELFHFVGFRHPDKHEKNYGILTKILSDQCISHPPHQKGAGETKITINWGADFTHGEFIVPTVTCFADIPFECLALHARKYGQFGLSIDRRALVYWHARLVIYVPYIPGDLHSISGVGLINHLRKTFAAFKREVVDKLDTRKPVYWDLAPDDPEKAVCATSNIFLKEFLAFIKPFDSTRDEDDPENYYMEREWRKFQNLELRPGYVQKVVVAADYVNRAKRDFPEYQDIVYECPVY